MTFWRWLKQNKEAVGIITALFFSLISLYLAFNPLPNKPVLNVFSSELNLDGGKVFVQNAGEAPCADLKIRYNGPSEFWLTYHYKESDIRYAQFANDTMSYPVSMSALIQKCEMPECEQSFDYLDINEIIPFRIKFKEKDRAYKIDVSCSGKKRSIILDPYCVNPPFFGWCNKP